MNSSTNAATSFSASSSRSSSPAELSDLELLAATRGLVGRSNQLLAALLAHLAEVEARGIHRHRACASLYTYCIYELRFSEDEAFRRVSAARFVRRFPALLDAVAASELHLTGLLMLGPHLTDENLASVLARAKHRTKKELARLVRQLDPLPDVPPRIEPLGPAPARLVPGAPTWSKFVGSMNPIRELAPGERPRDWMDTAETVNDADDGNESALLPAPVAPEAAEPPAPARLDPQRFCVQFTASEEYVKLIEEAKALLSHSDARVSLDELHLRAMRSFVAELKKQKYAVTARPRLRKSSGETPQPEAAGDRSHTGKPEPTPTPTPTPAAETPRRRGRHIPAAVRRAVFERDAGRCTFAEASGRRCSETHGLELHHLEAFAKGGEHSEQNLTLRCRAHNALAAEQDFGRDFVERQRRSDEHESWVSQQRDP